MRGFAAIILIGYVFMGMNSPVYAEEQSGNRKTEAENASRGQTSVRPSKGVTVLPGPFRVQSVQFKEVTIGGKPHLSAAVIFNKKIDPSTVQENVNIRMLKKNENHFWIDASTQGNVVQVRPTFITWVSGAELQTGISGGTARERISFPFH